MKETIEKIQEAPKLTPRQKKVLSMRGPFRVHSLNREAKKVSDRLVLVDPKREGLLADVAGSLIALKQARGGDYVIEDPRTTKILWSTVNVGVAA